MRNGSGFRRCFPVKLVTLAVVGLIIGYSWKPFSGLLGRVRLGAICRRRPGTGTRAFQRFRRWALKGVFESVFNILSEDLDFKYAMIDGTIVPVHQHGTGA
jgi:hypothetical protein